MFEKFIPTPENKPDKKFEKRELSAIELEARFNMGRALMYRDLVKAGFTPDSPDEEVTGFFHNWMGENGSKFMHIFETMMKEDEDFIEEWHVHPTAVADEMERRMNPQEEYKKAA